MSDPRPGQVSADAPWPVLAAILEHAGDSDRVTFAVSDVAPDGYIGPVVLGIDLLTDESGDALTFLARFDQTGCTVCTTVDGTSTVHADAVVDYTDGAVTVTTRLPTQPADTDRAPVAFCIINGIPYQVDVPVIIMPTTTPT